MSLKRQVVEEIHRPARKKFRRRRVVIKGLDDLFQADLVEMLPYAKQNSGYRYILVVINAFSKYAWAYPVKRKTGKDVTEAMKKVLRESTPRNLQTDNGKEFYNKDFQQLMKKHGVNHYSTYSTLKSSIVERLNRTLKTMMWKEFSFQGSYKWLQLLPKIIEKYNSTVHGTTGFKPKDVTKRNEKSILETSYDNRKVMDRKPIKYPVGTSVRVSKYREAFDKGYTPNWSTEIFKVDKVQFTNPATYILRDEKNEVVKGGFYEEELQRAKYPDIFLVEKVLRRKGNQVFVKWLGLDKTHNSWISNNNIIA